VTVVAMPKTVLVVVLEAATDVSAMCHDKICTTINLHAIATHGNSTLWSSHGRPDTGQCRHGNQKAAEEGHTEKGVLFCVVFWEMRSGPRSLDVEQTMAGTMDEERERPNFLETRWVSIRLFPGSVGLRLYRVEGGAANIGVNGATRVSFLGFKFVPPTFFVAKERLGFRYHVLQKE
jgi:hypothetical protein